MAKDDENKSGSNQDTPEATASTANGVDNEANAENDSGESSVEEEKVDPDGPPEVEAEMIDDGRGLSAPAGDAGDAERESGPDAPDDQPSTDETTVAGEGAPQAAPQTASTAGGGFSPGVVLFGVFAVFALALLLINVFRSGEGSESRTEAQRAADGVSATPQGDASAVAANAGADEAGPIALDVADAATAGSDIAEAEERAPGPSKILNEAAEAAKAAGAQVASLDAATAAASVSVLPEAPDGEANANAGLQAAAKEALETMDSATAEIQEAAPTLSEEAVPAAQQTIDARVSEEEAAASEGLDEDAPEAGETAGGLDAGAASPDIQSADVPEADPVYGRNRGGRRDFGGQR